jgi:hypothetical protein
VSNVAIVARQYGDPAGSRRWWAAALALYRTLEMADVLDGVACLLATEGRAGEALRLLTATTPERDRLGVPLLSPDQVADRDAALGTARAGLGPGAAGVEAAARDEAAARVEAAARDEAAARVGAAARDEAAARVGVAARDEPLAAILTGLQGFLA